MQLADWMRKEKITALECAARLRVHRSTVLRILPSKGGLLPSKRKPSWKLAARIERMTNGEVTANDWVTSQPPAASAASGNEVGGLDPSHDRAA